MIKFKLTAAEPKLPEWAAVVFYDPETKETYLPAQIGGSSEVAVALALGFDGTSYIRNGGHVYAPLSWLRREHTGMKAEFDRIAAKVVIEADRLGNHREHVSMAGMPEKPTVSYANVGSDGRKLLDAVFSEILNFNERSQFLPKDLSREEIKASLVNLLDNGLIKFFIEEPAIKLGIWEIHTGEYRILGDICRV